MMKLFDITEKYGKATYAYPFEPYIVPENFRGQPNYTYDLCIGCAACGIACPSNAIELKMNEEQTKLVWEFDCKQSLFGNLTADAAYFAVAAMRFAQLEPFA